MKIYIQQQPNGSLETIEINDDPLGKGGQGAVYNIKTAQYKKDYCIKIYLRDAQKAYEKIKYMVTHPPKNIKDNPSFRICWPVALAYDSNKNFIGYMMPLAFPKGHDLTILSTYQRKPLSKLKKFKDDTEWHDKYELDTEVGIRNRIMMLKNVAVALHLIHETGRYVLVDLKPENIDATGTGKVSIMDTDSIQISEGGRILHPATAFTPEYFAPEGKTLQKCKRPFTLQCDYFAAAVCFYQILTGTHPYSGTVLKRPYDNCTEVAQCIAEGLFAYGEKSSYISFPKGLNLQENFKNLPDNIQALFKRAFGSKNSERPSMAEWGMAFHSIVVGGVKVKGSTTKRPTAATTPFEITAIAFSDQDNNKVIRAIGSKLYTDVTYLCPQLSFTVNNPAGKINLRYRIINPKGKEITSSTTSGTIDASVKGPHKQEIGGWGNEKKTAYEVPGEYQIEIYHLNKCIYKSTFTIHPLSGKSTPKSTKYTTSTSGLPFNISSVSFASTDVNCNVMVAAGDTLYNDILYLNAQISGFASQAFSTDDIFIRITDPNGNVKTNSSKSSKAGFYQTKMSIKQSGPFTILLGGWGNDTGTSYSTAGKYKVEIYYQNNLLYSTGVHIYEKKKSTTPTPTTPKKSPRQRHQEGLWQKMNNAVMDLGDWFEDKADTIGDADIWMFIFAVIGGLGVLGGAIATGSWFWGIAVCVVGYLIGIWVVAIGGVVMGWIATIFANIARFIFYNIYTLLACIAVTLGVIFWQDIVDLAGGQRAYTPKSVTTTQQSATTTYICTSAEVLNIRKGPNTSSEVLGTIIPKQTIEVYSISNGWAKVKYNGKTAYASAKYLERIE